jgi:hypothetical protein
MGEVNSDPTFLRGRLRHFRNLAAHTRDEAMRPFYADMVASYEAELSAILSPSVSSAALLNTDQVSEH